MLTPGWGRIPGGLRWGGGPDRMNGGPYTDDAPGGPFQPTHSPVCESQRHAGSGWSGLESASTS